MGCAFQVEGPHKRRLTGTPSRAAFENCLFISFGQTCSELTLSQQITAASIAGFSLDSCPGTLSTSEHCKSQTTVSCNGRPTFPVKG